MLHEELLERIATRGSTPCLIADDHAHDYQELLTAHGRWLDALRAAGVPAGAVVSMRGDYRLKDIALLLALFTHRCVAALVPAEAADPGPLERSARVRFALSRGPSGLEVDGREPTESHPLLDGLSEAGRAGLVIFSSGSTGDPKAILHGVDGFLKKFETASKALRTLAFLVFDHIAGLDTLFYTLASGGTLVVPASRSPRAVCEAIERHRVQVLPTSPTFLRLLRLSGEYDRFDLGSLEVITYGAEPMDDGGLRWLSSTFPDSKIIQKYGTSEFGSPRARSRARDSLWLQLKSDELDAKVVDGILWIRSPGAMLGYLNAPSPFTDTGWFCTGDEAVVEGDWIRILGRKSELISVGGEKVHASQVEAVLLQLDFVEQALVYGEPNPLTGQIVCAQVKLTAEAQADADAIRQIRRHCRERLAPFSVPVRIATTEDSLASSRAKKRRRAFGHTPDDGFGG